MEKSSNILTSIITIIGILSFMLTAIIGNFPVWLASIFIIIAFILAMIVLHTIGCFRYLKAKASLLNRKIKYKLNKNDFMKELDLRIDDFSRLIDHSCSYSLKLVFQDNPDIKFNSEKIDIMDILFHQYKKKFSEYNKKVSINIFIYWLEEFKTFVIAFDKCLSDIKKSENITGESFKVELKLGTKMKYHFNHL